MTKTLEQLIKRVLEIPTAPATLEALFEHPEAYCTTQEALDKVAALKFILNHEESEDLDDDPTRTE